jgi:hypothetical protein
LEFAFENPQEDKGDEELEIAGFEQEPDDVEVVGLDGEILDHLGEQDTLQSPTSGPLEDLEEQLL